jgi:prolipoprotein diacylglyceryltransferase
VVQDTLEQSHVLHFTSHESICLQKNAVITNTFFLHTIFLIEMHFNITLAVKNICSKKKKTLKRGTVSVTHFTNVCLSPAWKTKYLKHNYILPVVVYGREMSFEPGCSEMNCQVTVILGACLQTTLE